MQGEFGFFTTVMPGSRPADYYLGCLDGSVFMDFDNCDNGCIRLSRISFDGYGCCNLKDRAAPMSEIDSQTFRSMLETEEPDQLQLTAIIKRTITSNRNLIWEDALKEYSLH